jgi:hypothetical protein
VSFSVFQFSKEPVFDFRAEDSFAFFIVVCSLVYSDSKNCPNVWHFLIVCDIASHQDQTEPKC